MNYNWTEKELGLGIENITSKEFDRWENDQWLIKSEFNVNLDRLANSSKLFRLFKRLLPWNGGTDSL